MKFRIPWPFRFEHKSLASPDAALLELFGAVPTAAGITVSAESALRVPGVAAAVRIISEAVATLPTQPEMPAWNSWTSAFDGLRQLVADALVQDCGGIAWVNRVNGKVAEIIRYQRGVINVALDANTGEPTYTIGARVLDPRDVIHVRNLFDRCPVTLAREAIATAIVLEQHASRLFGNGAKPSGVLSIKGLSGVNAIENVRTAWLAAHGPGKSGNTAVLSGDAKYEQLTLTSVDAQFLEMRVFTLAEISRAFRVPLPMLSDLSRATWSNSEQQGREFLVYCLEPWLRAVEAAFARVGISITFDRDDLSRASLSERAQAYSSLIASRVINPNEARAWEGLPSYTGGDAFVNPNITQRPSAP
jgi:HK97 family phage portal protein